MSAPEEMLTLPLLSNQTLSDTPSQPPLPEPPVVYALNPPTASVTPSHDPSTTSAVIDTATTTAVTTAAAAAVIDTATPTMPMPPKSSGAEESLTSTVINPSPLPTGSAPASGTKLFRAHRDILYDLLTESQLNEYGFLFDADVFQYNEDRTQLTSVVLNRSLYIPSEAFKEYHVDANGQKILTETSALRLDQWLRLWGKIPAFLEVKVVPRKDFGIVAKQRILKGVFLGYYDGIRHPLSSPMKNPYYYTYKNQKEEDAGYIDARNLTFSNFASMINDGHPRRYNVQFLLHTGQVMIVTTRIIEPGEELVGSYGELYWKTPELHKWD